MGQVVVSSRIENVPPGYYTVLITLREQDREIVSYEGQMVRVTRPVRDGDGVETVTLEVRAS